MLDLSGVPRRIAQVAAGTMRQLRMTMNESMAVAQVERPNQEFARSGRTFAGGCNVLANGIAPVQAIPTTTATLALYNADQLKSYVLDWISFQLLQGTPALDAALMIAMSPKKPTAVTSMATGHSVASTSASSQASQALWSAAFTLIGTPSWVTVASDNQTTSSLVGHAGFSIDLRGAWIIPPGGALGFCVMSGAGTSPLYGISAQWSEIQLDLE